jgi:hypothetical protein
MFADEATGGTGGDTGGSVDTNTSGDMLGGSGEDVSDLALDGTQTDNSDVSIDDEPIPSEDIQNSDTSVPTEKPSEPAPQKEPAPDGTAKPDEQSQGFNSEFIGKASKLGFSEAEVRAFGTPERFIGMLGNLAERIKVSQTPNKEPEKATDGQANPDKKPEQVQTDDDFNLDSDDYDPEFRKMGGVVKSLRQQNAELANRLKAIEERSNHEFTSLAEERQTQFNNWYESEMDTLGGDHPEIFGNKAEAASEAIKANRDTVLEDMAILANGYRNLGKPVPSKNELLKMAVNSRFSEQITKKEKTKALDEIRGEVDASKSRAINRPNGNTNNKVVSDPDKEGREYVRSRLKEFGVPVPAYDDSDVGDLAL